MVPINFGAIHSENQVTKKLPIEKKIEDRGHILVKFKCKLNQGLVENNLYAKFIVHSSNKKKVIAPKVENRRIDAPGVYKNHQPKFELRSKKVSQKFELTYIIQQW